MYFGFESVFASEHKAHQYQQLNARIFQNVNLKNKGRFVYNMKAGKFFGADAISFIDYKHFDGNQTHISSEDMYVNRFNLMPYYRYSTNKDYFEGHIEHNFQGFVMNRLPVFKKLNYLKLFIFILTKFYLFIKLFFLLRMERKYSGVNSSYLLSMYYGGMFPVGLLLGIICLGNYYWVSKYNFIRKS